MSANTPRLSFVTCVSNGDVLRRRLLSSPCLQPGGYTLAAFHNVSSAAAGFNAAMRCAAPGGWLVWVHQDVHLPTGWDAAFLAQLRQAEQQFANLAVAGVYGIVGAGANARRAGHVLDRGTLLHEPQPLPCRADSLDELLFAVSTNSALMLDAALGFDFYATDLVLQAQSQGLSCAVVDACCEHWSGTAAQPANVAPGVLARIAASAAVFEAKWRHRLPVTTPCFDIRTPGDTQRFLAG